MRKIKKISSVSKTDSYSSRNKEERPKQQLIKKSFAEILEEECKKRRKL